MTLRRGHDRVEYVEEPPQGSGVKLALGVAALALLLLFMAQNLQRVEMHFLWFDWHTRLLWALLVSTAVGAVAVAALTTLRRGGER